MAVNTKMCFLGWFGSTPILGNHGTPIFSWDNKWQSVSFVIPKVLKATRRALHKAWGHGPAASACTLEFKSLEPERKQCKTHPESCQFDFGTEDIYFSMRNVKSITNRIGVADLLALLENIDRQQRWSDIWRWTCANISKRIHHSHHNLTTSWQPKWNDHPIRLRTRTHIYIYYNNIYIYYIIIYIYIYIL